jgi:hypothetical protein
MEQIFRSLQFALNQAVLNPDNNMLELPEFGNYWILAFGIVNPLLLVVPTLNTVAVAINQNLLDHLVVLCVFSMVFRSVGVWFATADRFDPRTQLEASRMVMRRHVPPVAHVSHRVLDIATTTPSTPTTSSA